MKSPYRFFLAALALAVVPIAVTGGPLEKDARLAKRLSCPPGAWGAPKFFPYTFRTTSVRLYADDPEMKDAKFDAGFDSKTLASAMDGVAALWFARWERDSQGRYRLVNNKSELDIYLPKDDLARERYAAGLAFVDDIQGLPADAMKQLVHRAGDFDDVTAALPASQLPPEARSDLLRMIVAMNEQFRRNGSSTNFPLTLTGFKVQLTPKNPGGFDSYALSLYLPGWGSMSVSFNNYEQRTQAKEEEARKKGGGDDSAYEPKRAEYSEAQRKSLAVFQKRISLSGQKMTVPQVLKSLYARYRIAYVCDPAPAFPQRADLNITEQPLGVVLDNLEKTFKDTEWDYRKSGFLVVRAPGNPGRDHAMTGRVSETRSRRTNP